MNPQQLTTSLSNLVAWFPAHDPFELLQQNPQILENPNVEADPTYGKFFRGGWEGSGSGRMLNAALGASLLTRPQLEQSSRLYKHGKWKSREGGPWRHEGNTNSAAGCFLFCRSAP